MPDTHYVADNSGNRTHLTPDANGDVPDGSVLERRWRHQGNGKSYLATGVVFMPDFDKWGYVLVESEGDIPQVRSHRNFHGRLADGRVRFVAV